MKIISKEALADNFIKDVMTRMLSNDNSLQGGDMRTFNLINTIELSGQSLEDYVEMNPQEAGQAFAAVLFDYLGGDSLRKVVLSE